MGYEVDVTRHVSYAPHQSPAKVVCLSMGGVLHNVPGGNLTLTANQEQNVEDFTRKRKLWDVAGLTGREYIRALPVGFGLAGGIKGLDFLNVIASEVSAERRLEPNPAVPLQQSFAGSAIVMKNGAPCMQLGGAGDLIMR